jgi:3',5'-cyclic AMP phosphodiesterase CpdA
MSYQFIVLSDTHFFAPGNATTDKTYWNRVLQSRSEQIAASIVDTVRGIKPDFIIHCGDITGYGEMSNVEFSRQVMDASGSPWYAVPGNHDTWFPGVRAELSQRYGLSSEQCHYSLGLAGLRFIFLDVAYWHSIKGNVSLYLDKELYDNGQIAGMGPSPDELSWFETELTTVKNEPVVLVSHAPLGFKPKYRIASLPHGLPVPEGQISLVDRMGDVVLRRALRDLIHRSSQVVLALSGHWHINDVQSEDGVVYCQTASMREFPFEMRRCVVYPDHLAISTIGLNDPDFSRSSYVSEWGNSWVAGTAGDRKFSVSLS